MRLPQLTKPKKRTRIIAPGDLVCVGCSLGSSWPRREATRSPPRPGISNGPARRSHEPFACTSWIRRNVEFPHSLPAICNTDRRRGYQGPEPSQKSAAFWGGFAISSATHADTVFPAKGSITATAGHHSAEQHFFLVATPDEKHLFFVTPGRGRRKVRFRPAFCATNPGGLAGREGRGRNSPCPGWSSFEPSGRMPPSPLLIWTLYQQAFRSVERLAC